MDKARGLAGIAAKHLFEAGFHHLANDVSTLVDTLCNELTNAALALEAIGEHRMDSILPNDSQRVKLYEHACKHYGRQARAALAALGIDAVDRFHANPKLRTAIKDIVRGLSDEDRKALQDELAKAMGG